MLEEKKPRIQLLRTSTCHWRDRWITADSSIKVIIGHPAGAVEPWWDLTDPCAGLGYHILNLRKIISQQQKIDRAVVIVPPLHWRFSPEPWLWGCEAPVSETIDQQISRVRAEIQEIRGLVTVTAVAAATRFTAERLDLDWVDQIPVDKYLI